MSEQLPAAYVHADTVDKAVELVSADAETRVVAGGYSLLPQVKDGIETPDRLVDVSRIDELRGISHEAGETCIGALTTHHQIATFDLVHEHVPALAEAADSVGDYQARQQGTIAGNLVFADPKYDPPAAFLALDGRVVARSPDGERTIGADEWFCGPGETALGPDEIVTDVVVPDAKRSGYVRTSEYSGYAIVGTAAALDVDGDAVASARVAVNGVKPFPIRLPNVEDELVGKHIDDELRSRAASAELSDINLETLLMNGVVADHQRLQLVRTYCRQAIERAIEGD
ncbi:FAD binding domain-containing protein [Natrialba taiwanensis]|uniref:FAD-binding PCMH-type domain-containing protein n=1 Tax=Natrialba taiwanensis DSM 12281 TaxID=1230458 RepID=L9ZKY7_9EURY|nr:xanthine dehydrogenase family protein subunit M [Natrialba taiwanensis]ELY86222.1 hypothetical protein C484_18427 [Natrialba taiwanensis DSM 12281]